MTSDYSQTGGSCRLDYQVPSHSIKGPEVVELVSNNYEEISHNFEEAIFEGLKKARDKQRKRGVTIILSLNVTSVDIMALVEAITKSGRPYPLIYMHSNRLKYNEKVNHAWSKPIRMWLEKRDERDLITDLPTVRGWEDDTVLVLDDCAVNIENLCLRAISNLVISYFGGHKYEEQSMLLYNEMLRVAEIEDDLDKEEELEEENVDEERKNWIRGYLDDKIRNMKAELESENVDEDRKRYIRRYFEDKKSGKMEERLQNKVEEINDMYYIQDSVVENGKDRLEIDKIGSEKIEKNINKKKTEKDWFQKGFLLNRKKQKKKEKQLEDAFVEDEKKSVECENLWFPKGFLLQKK